VRRTWTGINLVAIDRGRFRGFWSLTSTEELRNAEVLIDGFSKAGRIPVRSGLFSFLGLLQWLSPSPHEVVQYSEGNEPSSSYLRRPNRSGLRVVSNRTPAQGCQPGRLGDRDRETFRDHFDTLHLYPPSASITLRGATCASSIPEYRGSKSLGNVASADEPVKTPVKMRVPEVCRKRQ